MRLKVPVIACLISALFVFFVATGSLLMETFFVLLLIGYMFFYEAHMHMWEKFSTGRLPPFKFPPNIPEFCLEFVRWRRLHRTLLEVALPPHLICPRELNHLSLNQWRKIANDFWPAWNEAIANGKEFNEWINEWLAALGLPPVARNGFSRKYLIK
jgi:hypothetical protein